MRGLLVFNSLVLSTYNGARYVRDQLDSLVAQTLPFDEVLVSDDCSTDETAEIVRSCICERELNNWFLSVNPENRGWKRNFHDLIRRASGDYVFLCDQDDIWLPEKVACMVGVMETHSDIDLLACDVEPFYEEGSQKLTDMRGTLCDCDGRIEAVQVDNHAVYVQRPGCSYCVRGSFIGQVEPYWDESWAHDAVLWMLAESKGSLALYRKPLVRFRRHEGNASARKKMTREVRTADIRDLLSRVDKMEMFSRDLGCLTPEKEETLENFRAWLDAREGLLESRRLDQLGKVLSGHSRYVSTKGMLVDLILTLFRNARL
jgi:glycosyltransferase involved in cell wall biosynthesis